MQKIKGDEWRMEVEFAKTKHAKNWPCKFRSAPFFAHAKQLSQPVHLAHSFNWLSYKLVGAPNPSRLRNFKPRAINTTTTTMASFTFAIFSYVSTGIEG